MKEAEGDYFNHDSKYPHCLSAMGANQCALDIFAGCQGFRKKLNIQNVTACLGFNSDVIETQVVCSLFVVFFC